MKRLKYPFEGFLYLLRKDYHYFAHLAVGMVVIILSAVLKISAVEWMFILSAIFLVLIAEAVNTAIEDVVDLVTKEIRPLAKSAKDVASFGVLLASIYAATIGFIIFLPKLLTVFNLI